MKFFYLVFSFFILSNTFAQIDNFNITKISVVDKKGNLLFYTAYEYNSAGKLSKIVHLDPVTKKPNPSHFSEYIYENDRLVLINEGAPVLDKPGVYKKNSDVFSYNEQGKITSIKTYNALGGKGTTLNVNSYTYDSEGNLASKVVAAKMSGTKDSVAFGSYLNGRPQEYSYFNWEKKKRAYGAPSIYKITYDENNNLVKRELLKDGVANVTSEASYNKDAKNYVHLKISDYNKFDNNPNPGNLDFNTNFCVFTKIYNNTCSAADGTVKTVPYFMEYSYDYTAIKTGESGYVTSYKEEYKKLDCVKKNKQIDGNDTYYQIEYSTK